jgi:hypothetical protein
MVQVEVVMEVVLETVVVLEMEVVLETEVVRVTTEVVEAPTVVTRRVLLDQRFPTMAMMRQMTEMGMMMAKGRQEEVVDHLEVLATILLIPTEQVPTLAPKPTTVLVGTTTSLR